MLCHGGLIGAAGVSASGSFPSLDLSAGGMTFGYVTDNGLNTSISCSVPSNVVNGDLMIAFAVCGSLGNPSSISIPAGWTSIILETGVNGQWFMPFALSWRVASSEPASHDWTITAGDRDDAVAIVRVVGANTSSPISGTPAVAHDYGLTPVSPSVTTAHENALAVFGFCVKNGWMLNAQDAGYPSGCTGVFARYSRQSSNGVCFALTSLGISTSGATGSKTWSALSGSAEIDEFSFAIRAA